MFKAISQNEVTNCHRNFIKTYQSAFKESVPFIEEHVSELIRLYNIYNSLSEARYEVKLFTIEAVEDRKKFIVEADDFIMRVSHLLKASTTPVIIKEYIPNPLYKATKYYDRLSIIDRLINVSDYYKGAHLKEHLPRLLELKEKGHKFYNQNISSRNNRMDKVVKLAKAKREWESQYQRLKFFFRGIFHDTNTDYSWYFRDMHTPSHRPPRSKKKQDIGNAG